MPASRLNSKSCSGIRHPRSLAALLIAASAALAGCAGSSVTPPSLPDDSALQPAEQALAEARAAQADTFAPRSVDASRRRIATARDILFAAARARRPLTDSEQSRVDQLVAAAQLDARSALVETQARAVQTKLEELQGQTGTNAASSPSPQPRSTMGVSP